jgi:hypothetical protein
LLDTPQELTDPIGNDWLVLRQSLLQAVTQLAERTLMTR